MRAVLEVVLGLYRSLVQANTRSCAPSKQGIDVTPVTMYNVDCHQQRMHHASCIGARNSLGSSYRAPKTR